MTSAQNWAQTRSGGRRAVALQRIAKASSIAPGWEIDAHSKGASLQGQLAKERDVVTRDDIDLGRFISTPDVEARLRAGEMASSCSGSISCHGSSCAQSVGSPIAP